MRETTEELAKAPRALDRYEPPATKLLAQARQPRQRTLPRAKDLPDPSVIYGNIVMVLITRRRELGLRQLEVDEIAGFTAHSVAKYELGDRRPTAYALCIWSAALNSHLVSAPLSIPREVRKIGRRRPWRRTSRRACAHSKPAASGGKRSA